MMRTVDSPDGDVQRSLVDDEGRIWACTWSQWATPQQIHHMIARGRHVAVRHPGEPTVWLSADQARALGHRITLHIEVPGTSDARPDVDGFTYGAHIWRSGDSRLLCIEVFC